MRSSESETETPLVQVCDVWLTAAGLDKETENSQGLAQTQLESRPQLAAQLCSSQVSTILRTCLYQAGTLRFSHGRRWTV